MLGVLSFNISVIAHLLSSFLIFWLTLPLVAFWHKNGKETRCIYKKTILTHLHVKNFITNNDDIITKNAEKIIVGIQNIRNCEKLMIVLGLL